MSLVYKLSFIISGIFIRDIIFYNSIQSSEIFILIFVIAAAYQYLYAFIFYRRDGDDISIGKCLTKWVLYYTITIEAVILITYIMNFTYRGTLADNLLTTGPRDPEPYIILAALSTCIAYQIIYFVIKKLITKDG
ncbi:MAG: hypothetical protein FWE74_03885 [Oscillospiraceae bacterium]|nr:hypothetical protein [Oscillospiraceae bacterium]